MAGPSKTTTKKGGPPPEPPTPTPDGRPESLASIAVSKEHLLAWYEQMLLIRRVEELAAKAYTQRKILGFCHLYIGQEAVAVGATAALEKGDTVVTAYRDHGRDGRATLPHHLSH